jgi:hypothetical protein
MMRALPPRRFVPTVRAFSRVAAALALGTGIAATIATGCGAEDGLVGGDCAAGYTQCGLSCVDLENDPSNCGACGHACPAGVACVDGTCGGTALDGAMLADAEGSEDGSLGDAFVIPDGEICDTSDPGRISCRPRPRPDGASDGDGSEEGSAEDATSGDGNPNAGDGTTTTDGSASDATLADACAPPYDTPASCGSCGNVCVAPASVCDPEDGGFQCADLCSPPLTDCSGECVDLTSDPNNCGSCGNRCQSQYCYLSMCQGILAGNIMVIGHDFQKTKPGDEEALLLTNSVFYNAGAVSLVSYEHYADAPTVANGLSILSRYATAQHITLTVQSTSSDTALANDTTFAGVSAVIVWDQPNAPAGTLGTLGTSWAPHLSKFVQRGGIAIGLDADRGVAEMPGLFTNAALLAVTGHGQVMAGSPANVPLAGLAVARGMTSVYAVEQNTAWFTTSEAQTSTTLYVANVQGETTELVAVQKVVN